MLIVVWFVSIITLLKYPLPEFSDSVSSTLQMETTVMDGKVKFEETLRKMNKDDKNTNKSHSAFGSKFLCKVAYFMFSFFCLIIVLIICKISVAEESEDFYQYQYCKVN